MYSVDILTFTLPTVLTVLGSAVGLGILIALSYLLSHLKSGIRPALIPTLVMIAPIVSMIILAIYVTVGNNMARAISIGGGLALIRFRNTLEDPRDLIFIYLSLAAGVLTGTGLIGVALLSVGILAVLFCLLLFLPFGSMGGGSLKLRILIPEEINYEGLFDDLFKSYCRSVVAEKIKTADYGTLLELSYRVVLRDKNAQKAFIDALRERNGNLTVSLTRGVSEE